MRVSIPDCRTQYLTWYWSLRELNFESDEVSIDHIGGVFMYTVLLGMLDISTVSSITCVICPAHTAINPKYLGNMALS